MRAVVRPMILVGVALGEEPPSLLAPGWPMFRNRTAEKMHEVALMRLRRAQRATEDYFHVRYDQRLHETFDDWGVGVSEADRVPATRTRLESGESVPESDVRPESGRGEPPEAGGQTRH